MANIFDNLAAKLIATSTPIDSKSEKWEKIGKLAPALIGAAGAPFMKRAKVEYLGREYAPTEYRTKLLEKYGSDEEKLIAGQYRVNRNALVKLKKDLKEGVYGEDLPLGEDLDEVKKKDLKDQIRVVRKQIRQSRRKLRQPKYARSKSEIEKEYFLDMKTRAMGGIGGRGGAGVKKEKREAAKVNYIRDNMKLWRGNLAKFYENPDTILNAIGAVVETIPNKNFNDGAGGRLWDNVQSDINSIKPEQAEGIINSALYETKINIKNIKKTTDNQRLRQLLIVKEVANFKKITPEEMQEKTFAYLGMPALIKAGKKGKPIFETKEEYIDAAARLGRAYYYALDQKLKKEGKSIEEVVLKAQEKKLKELGKKTELKKTGYVRNTHKAVKNFVFGGRKRKIAAVAVTVAAPCVAIPMWIVKGITDLALLPVKKIEDKIWKMTGKNYIPGEGDIWIAKQVTAFKKKDKDNVYYKEYKAVLNNIERAKAKGKTEEVKKLKKQVRMFENIFISTDKRESDFAKILRTP